METTAFENLTAKLKKITGVFKPTEKGFFINSPGVKLEDLDKFFIEILGDKSLLPDEKDIKLPLKQVTLYSLALTSDEEDTSYDLEFKLLWEKSDKIEIKDTQKGEEKSDIFTLTNIHADFKKEGDKFSANLSANMKIKDIEFGVDISLPDLILEAHALTKKIDDVEDDDEVKKEEEEEKEDESFIEKILPKELIPSKADAIILRDIKTMIAIRQKLFLFHLELENLFKIGFFELGIINVDVAYSKEEKSCSIYTEMNIDTGIDDEPIVLLMEGEHETRSGEDDESESELILKGGLAPNEGNEIKVGQIIQSFGVTVPDALSDMKISRLWFETSILSNPKTFDFDISVEDVLKFKNFEIQEVSLSLKYTGEETAKNGEISKEEKTGEVKKTGKDVEISKIEETLPSKFTGSIKGKFKLLDSLIFTVETEKVSAGTEDSWIFTGSLEAEGNIGEILKKITDSDKVPKFLEKISIKQIDLAYNSSSGDFEFEFKADAKELFGEKTEAELFIKIELKKTGKDDDKSYQKTFTGSLIFSYGDKKKLKFDVLFDMSKESGEEDQTTFIAAYENLGSSELNIGELLEKIDPAFGNFKMTISLKDAFFIYRKKGGEIKSNILFGVDIGSSINLGNLPLVGSLFPEDQSLKIDVQPFFATGPKKKGIYFTEDDLSGIQSMIPDSGIKLPQKNIDTEAGLFILLQMGDKSFPIDIPIKLSSPQNKEVEELKIEEKKVEKKEKGKEKEKEEEKQEKEESTSLQRESDDGIKWFEIQKSFGPVQFNRIGVAYAEGKISAFLDASLGLGGLTLSMDGLGVTTPIDKFDPEFSLMGLGLNFEQGPIEIGGYFLRTKVPATDKMAAYDEYSGSLIFKIKQLSISAIGSYANINGSHSVFIYASLNYPIGGDPLLFITGLAAGFGYNRAIKMPDITGVKEFPLVSEVINNSAESMPAKASDRREYLTKKMRLLQSVITPQPGQYFFAIGIRFSSYELVDTFALVAVQLGNHFEFNILGMSTLVFPKPLLGETIDPVIQVQMAIKVVINPDAGFFSVEAQLTASSYLLSRECHLTGGFAFYVWFDGPNKGDFVISLGGYHPKFVVPAHYPKVPRLGFSWKLTENIYIKGELYFALTAHAFMLGGRLEAVFQSGGIKAWFIIGADFIISWKPFFYDANMYVDIGVSVTFWFFGTQTISVNIGASLHIWGPEFSGTATINLWIVSFTVSWGNAKPRPLPIEWSEFKTSFLPDDKKIISVTIAGGLVSEGIDKDKKTKLYIVNRKEVILSVSSLVPMKSYQIFKDNVKRDKLYFADPNKKIISKLVDKKNYQEHTQSAASGFGIAPMDVKSVTESSIKIEISLDKVIVNENFAFTPLLKKMPQAMWGDKILSDVNGERFIENALCGFDLQPAEASKPGYTHSVEKSALEYSTKKNINSFIYTKTKSYVTERAKKEADFKNIRGDEVNQRRNSLLKAMGFNTDILQLDVPPEMSGIFVEQPKKAVLT